MSSPVVWKAGVTATGLRTGRLRMVPWRPTPDLFSPVSSLACVDRNKIFTLHVMLCLTVAFVKCTACCFLDESRTRSHAYTTWALLQQQTGRPLPHCFWCPPPGPRACAVALWKRGMVRRSTWDIPTHGIVHNSSFCPMILEGNDKRTSCKQIRVHAHICIQEPHYIEKKTLHPQMRQQTRWVMAHLWEAIDMRWIHRAHAEKAI